jgi:CubicO group peptidase (beta-lactamase class C family)
MNTTITCHAAAKVCLPLQLSHLSDLVTHTSFEEFLDSIRAKEPIYAPNQKSTYSNVAFNLLGLALENVTGLPYSRYIERSIFEPLNMTSSSLEKPDDSVAVLPKGNNYWDIEEGVQRPTGGIYSSSADLSRYLRYILTHYNALTPALNWLHPSSYSTGLNSFFGMPWEIYRTANILPDTDRPVTFVTKSGGLPGYVSIIMIVPDYDLGVTILVGGNGQLLSKLRKLVTVPLVEAIERMAFDQMSEKYGGTYGKPHEPLDFRAYYCVLAMLRCLPIPRLNHTRMSSALYDTNSRSQSALTPRSTLRSP